MQLGPAFPLPAHIVCETSCDWISHGLDCEGCTLGCGCAVACVCPCWEVWRLSLVVCSLPHPVCPRALRGSGTGGAPWPSNTPPSVYISLVFELRCCGTCRGAWEQSSWCVCGKGSQRPVVLFSWGGFPQHLRCSPLLVLHSAPGSRRHPPTPCTCPCTAGPTALMCPS
jgi:hypothetical protein